MTPTTSVSSSAGDASDGLPLLPLVTSQPLRVLHVHSGNLYGGVETMLATLARCGSPEHQLQMQYALCFGGRLSSEFRAAGAVVHDLSPVRFRNPLTVVRARRRLTQLLRRQHFDAVVTHSCWSHALFASVAQRAGRPVVFWQHGFVGSGHWIERLAARISPHLVISNSHSSAATLSRLFPGVGFEIVHYPVAPPAPLTDANATRAAVRRELNTPDDAVVIVQSSRLERWKGQTLLLEALGRLGNRSDWVAWIVGGAQRSLEQAYAAELVAQAQRLGIGDRVRFVGQRTDVARLLAAADIHCQPNLGPEPFGIAFIEALYASLPVVTTRLGGATEILTAECGVLVPPGDPVALADALDQIIRSPSERLRLGAVGPAHAVRLCDPAQALARLSRLLLKSIGAE